MDAYAASAATIIAAAYEGEYGNPVLFSATHFGVLATVTGDRGGRRLIKEREDAVLLETADPGITQDVDYEGDVGRYTE